MDRWLSRAKDWLTEYHLKFSSVTDGIVPGWVAALLAIWCLADFATFVIGIFVIGGDAFNGYSEGGYYFVCMHGHAVCHEVGRALFEYSRLHAISLFISFPIALLLGWLARQPRD